MDHVEQDQALDRPPSRGGRQLAPFQKRLGELLANEAGAAGDHDAHLSLPEFLLGAAPQGCATKAQAP